MKTQKAGFQNREDGVDFQKVEAQVYIITYMRTALPKLASYSMSNTLRQRTHRYQSPLPAK
ncbi:hypothetical protein NV377_16395 [Paenibacillus sp. T3-5-0-4]|nr:hypothetical protein [Paenibacillus endoradicis]